MSKQYFTQQAKRNKILSVTYLDVMIKTKKLFRLNCWMKKMISSEALSRSPYDTA